MHEEGVKKNLYFLETAPHDDINQIERYMIFEGKRFMVNGKRSTAKMTWQEFTEWQRWDEFPEKADDPPMTVDVMFFYKGNTYYIDWEYEQYHILDKDWNPISSNKNLLTLLTSPVHLFSNKSFRDIINEIDFDA